MSRWGHSSPLTGRDESRLGRKESHSGQTLCRISAITPTAKKKGKIMLSRAPQKNGYFMKSPQKKNRIARAMSAEMCARV